MRRDRIAGATALFRELRGEVRSHRHLNWLRRIIANQQRNMQRRAGLDAHFRIRQKLCEMFNIMSLPELPIKFPWAGEFERDSLMGFRLITANGNKRNPFGANAIKNVASGCSADQ